jgi:hypothetical protein
MGIITALKFPLKLLTGLVRKRRKKFRSELAEKQRAYVRNFDPTRLKNISWQKSLGKDKRKRKGKKKYKVNSSKKN